MVVGHFAQDAFGAVDLLKQDHAGQFVGQGHVREAQDLEGPLPHAVVQAPGSAHDKAGPSACLLIQAAQQGGQLGRRELLAVFVQHKGHVLRRKSFNDAASFKGLTLVRRQGGIAVAHFSIFQMPPAFDARKVVGCGVLPERCFQLAHTDTA